MTAPSGKRTAGTAGAARIDQCLHTSEGFQRPFLGTLLLILVQLYRIERGGEGAPMRRRTLNRRSKVTRTVAVREAQLCRFLAKPRRAHVGPLGDVEQTTRGPAEIGQAARRETVCQTVLIPEGA